MLTFTGHPLVERFMSYVDTTADCWNWTGSGAPVFRVDGKVRAASRLAWALFKGGVPAGGLILNRCGNGLCVNPRHQQLACSRIPKRLRLAVRMPRALREQVVLDKAAARRMLSQGVAPEVIAVMHGMTEAAVVEMARPARGGAGVALPG